MGTQLLDQYSLLHAAVGVIMYFWNIPFWISVIMHIVFEWAENTRWGIRAINTYIIDPGYFSWPGEKRSADSIVNSVGDTLTFSVGWLVAAGLDGLDRHI
jgi:hypothetical protein